MGDRISKDLTSRTLNTMRAQLGTSRAVSISATKFNAAAHEDATRKQRVVLLNLNNSDELSFWQVLHNTPESFEIISTKESHQRGEYVVRVIFYELGDDLPTVRTLEELLEIYNA